MTDPWPWLVLVGLGVVHGAHPLGGWALAAASAGSPHAEARAIDFGPVLVAIAIGHLAALVVATSFVLAGVSTDRAEVARITGAVLVIVAITPWLPARTGSRTRQATALRHLGCAFAAFCMGSLSGVGLMLLPAIGGLCVAALPAPALVAGGSLPIALGAVAVHLATMLATTGLCARCSSRFLARLRPDIRRVVGRIVWSTALLGVAAISAIDRW